MSIDLARMIILKEASLDLRISGSYTFNSNKDAHYTPTYIGDNGKAYRGEFKNEKWIVNGMLSFGKSWGEHHLETMSLTEYQKDRKTGFWTEVKGVTSNAFGYDNLGVASTLAWGGTSSNYDQPWLGSVMGSATYSFSGYAKVTLTTRGDTSSMVDKKYRWGWFPSISSE